MLGQLFNLLFSTRLTHCTHNSSFGFKMLWWHLMTNNQLWRYRVDILLHWASCHFKVLRHGALREICNENSILQKLKYNEFFGYILRNALNLRSIVYGENLNPDLSLVSTEYCREKNSIGFISSPAF